MNNEQLNALKERAYKTAVAHGFHENVKPTVFYLGLVMSEMGEAINADRKGWHANSFLFENDEKEGFPFAENFKKHIKDTLEDEIADIVIRLLDFAGLKGFKLSIIQEESYDPTHFLSCIEKYTLPGFFFALIGVLSDASSEHVLGNYICSVIGVLSDCFGKMTGSDKDLWWFVEKKMAYNELRPMLNGKKY